MRARKFFRFWGETALVARTLTPDVPRPVNALQVSSGANDGFLITCDADCGVRATSRACKTGDRAQAKVGGRQRRRVSAAMARGSANIGSLEAPRRRLLPALYH